MVDDVHPAGDSAGHQLTQLLASARLGDQVAAGAAFSLLYEELRRLARTKLRQHQSMTLLDTTSLLHESYLKLVGASSLPVEDRHHFFTYAARADLGARDGTDRNRRSA